MKTTVLANLKKGIVTHTTSESFKVRLTDLGFIQIANITGRDICLFKADKLEYIPSGKILVDALKEYREKHFFACTFKKKDAVNIGFFYARNLTDAKVTAKKRHGKNFLSVNKAKSFHKQI